MLSNGSLRERADLPDGRRTRWHYTLDLPQPAYLLTLVAGPFVELRDRAPQTGVDVYAFVPPGREEDGRRSFARTGAMIDHFSEKIGVPYPHARYSQITVPEFIFGGMENTTATTLTDLVLLDERAALDHDIDGLVSHELAHQWWGDLLTCREWSEGWLNEGFATYFEYVWREHAKGRDEADHELLADTDGYLTEAGRYQRPVVCRQYDEPIHLFDAHLYEKGGRVLHMLRHELGEPAFWRALRHYARKHARGSVETRDLARAIEDATGRSVEAFLDRWIARPGHPDFAAEWRWDEERKVGTLSIAQKQPVAPETPLFELGATVRFEIDGRTQDVRVAIREAAHAFELPLPVRPTQVIFDPGDVILKSIKFTKGGALWRRQLAAGELAVDRVLAARALGELPDPANLTALKEALAQDRFWGVRGAAARALGKTRRAEARDILIGALRDAEPRVRRAAAAGLGNFVGDDVAGRALAERLDAGDASVFVEAELALALGKTRSPEALSLLPRLVDRPSYMDLVASRAIDGLGQTGRRAGAAPHPRRVAPRRRLPRAAGGGRRAGRAGARNAAGARGAGSDRAAPRRPRLPRPRRGGGGARPPGAHRRIARVAQRPGRRAGRPHPPPHQRRDPRHRRRVAPRRGGAPPARRGRTPARRDRQPARADGPARGAPRQHAARPRSEGQAPAPDHAPGHAHAAPDTPLVAASSSGAPGPSWPDAIRD